MYFPRRIMRPQCRRSRQFYRGFAMPVTVLFSAVPGKPGAELCIIQDNDNDHSVVIQRQIIQEKTESQRN